MSKALDSRQKFIVASLQMSGGMKSFKQVSKRLTVLMFLKSALSMKQNFSESTIFELSLVLLEKFC